MSLASGRVILFRRDYHGLTGGHLKVWHYFQHASKSHFFVPRIYLTPASSGFACNPWKNVIPSPLVTWRPDEAAVLFVAGLDWESIPDPAPRPVINLIQSVRHGNAGDIRRQYLSRPAVRICVSDEVAAAIRATGEVNGPVSVIPAGIDFKRIPRADRRDIGILIAGAKNPTFANALHVRLARAGMRAMLLTHVVPRDEFLSILSRSVVAVTIPHPQEGFFLPALEAMAAGAVVVCPDCLGNRGFCVDSQNCFRPSYQLEDVVRATIKAVSLSPDELVRLRFNSRDEVLRRGLDAECADFLRILDAESSQPRVLCQGQMFWQASS